jgi:hypothetical protein
MGYYSEVNVLINEFKSWQDSQAFYLEFKKQNPEQSEFTYTFIETSLFLGKTLEFYNPCCKYYENFEEVQYLELFIRYAEQQGKAVYFVRIGEDREDIEDKLINNAIDYPIPDIVPAHISRISNKRKRTLKATLSQGKDKINNG